MCAGSYTGTEFSLGALRVGFDAGAWNGALVGAAAPPALLTLVLAALLGAGWRLLERRRRSPGAPGPWMRRVEPVLAGAAGLALTGFTAWEFHLWESRHRREAFVQLAAVRTEAVAQTLHAIADAGLEGLARFYENSSEVTEEEFRQFTPYLAKNRAVQAWVWVPEVPVTGLSQFQAEARAKASAGFEVWEKDAQGRRAPAGGRAMYYPVLHVAPLAGNELAAGYDRSGQCYSFRQLPVLGGTYAPENRMAFPIREHFRGWGSVHRQMADLPDGSHVIIKLAG